MPMENASARVFNCKTVLGQNNTTPRKNLNVRTNLDLQNFSQNALGLYYQLGKVRLS